MATPKKLNLVDLTDAEIKDTAKGLGIKVTGLSRPKMVSAIRDEGVGLDPASELVATLCATISELSKEVKGLREEVSLLRLQAEENRALRETINSQGALKDDLESLKKEVAAIRHVQSESNHVYQPDSTAFPAISRSSTTEPHMAFSNALTSRQNKDPSSPNSARGPDRRDDDRKQIERRITSTFIKPKPTVEPISTLQGKKRTPRRAFHLGDISPGVTANVIVSHCAKEGIEVFTCRVTESRDTAFAHLVLSKADEDRVKQPGFWPDDITIRPWEFKKDNLGLCK